MMGNGDAYELSFDGVLLILMDLFHFVFDQSMHKISSMNEVLTEIKSYLQNMLFAIILTADKYPGCNLDALLCILTMAYQGVPEEKGYWKLPSKNLRLELHTFEQVPEFFYGENLLKDKSVRESIQEMRNEDLVEEFARRNLTPDVLSSFIGSCFTKYLIENNVQIYDIHTLLPSSKYFDVCLAMRSMLGSQGVTMRQCMMFIEEIVYKIDERIEHKDLILPKVTKKITELVQTSKPLGRKAALREEKKLKLQADFSYVNEKEKAAKEIAKTYIGLGRGEIDDAGLNSEAIFFEFYKMKSFSREAIKLLSQGPHQDMVSSLLKLSKEKLVSIRASDFGALFSLKFCKSQAESVKLNRIRFLNQVCEVLTKTNEADELENFLSKIELAKLDQEIFTQLGKYKSFHIEAESLTFLMFILRQSSISFRKLANYFLTQGDELYNIARQIFGKRTLKCLDMVIKGDMNQVLAIQVALRYLDFISELYIKIFEEGIEKSLLYNADKLCFHLYRRFGEFFVAMDIFFKNQNSHLYVCLADLDHNLEEEDLPLYLLSVPGLCLFITI